MPVTGWSVQYGASARHVPGSVDRADGDDPARRATTSCRRRPATGGTVDLPTPNATDRSQNGGPETVALVTNGDPGVRCRLRRGSACGDFVGYGAANDVETAPTPR